MVIPRMFTVMRAVRSTLELLTKATPLSSEGQATQRQQPSRALSSSSLVLSTAFFVLYAKATLAFRVFVLSPSFLARRAQDQGLNLTDRMLCSPGFISPASSCLALSPQYQVTEDVVPGMEPKALRHPATESTWNFGF